MKISIENIGYAELVECNKSSISREAYGISKELNMSKIRYLQELRVYPEHRMKGYSKQLLDKVKLYCDDNDLVICLDAMPLDTSIKSDILKKLYLKNGFNHVGGTAFNYGNKYDTSSV